MAGIGDLVANLTVNGSGWSKGLKAAKTDLGSFASGIGSVIAPIAGAIAAAWGTASSVSAYKTQLEAERKLGAVLETTGHAAGLTGMEIKKLAGDLQGVTNFGDEATISAAGLLATFKEVKGDVFAEAIVSAQDMSAVMGTDLKGSVMQLGKALNNPIQGMSALADAGVSFTDEQKKQIKTMQEAGNIAGAQQVILQELQGEFGGAAKAMADPWTQAKNAIGDVGEMIGSLLLPAIDVVSVAITGGAAFLTTYGDTFKAIGIEAAVWLSAIGGMFYTLGESIVGALTPVVSWIFDTFQGMFGSVTAGGMSFQEMGVEAIVALSHIGDVLKITATKWSLFFVQIGNDAAFVFTDKLPSYITWFADNWQNIIFTAVDYTLTVFANLGQNIRNTWDYVIGYLTGNPIELDWRPLTEGAVSTIAALPDIPDRVATQLEESMAADIDGMTAALGQSMDAQRAELNSQIDQQREALSAKYEGPSFALPDIPTDEQAKGKGKDNKLAGAQQRGSADAYSTIAQAFMRGNNDPQVKAIDKSTKAIVGAIKSNKPKPMNVMESIT